MSAWKACDISSWRSCYHQDYTFVSHANGTTMAAGDMSDEMMLGMMQTTTLEKQRCIYEDENILNIGLNRALELIDRSNKENVLFIEPISGIPVTLKNGRFGEYTEFNGFNKATKLKGRVTYDPDAFNYQDEGDRIKVLKSLRILGFEEESKIPIGVKIKKLGKAFKFKKVFKFGEDEFECPDNFYKLDEDEQRELVIEAIKPKKVFFLE